jgi:hypothetical protein
MRVAKCYACGREGWVNAVIADRNVEDGEYCADCFDNLNIGPIHRPPAGQSGPHRFNNDPWGDNAVRALEEDR